MFRTLLMLTAALMLAAPVFADDLKLKAAAALALSAPSLDCGECIFDESEARLRSLKEHRPLVLIVGECRGRGKEVVAAGGIPCIVSDYTRDGKPATESRIVVLKPGDTDFELSANLSEKATADEVRKAIGAATPEPPKVMPSTKPLDWESLTVHATDAPKKMKVCVNGICYLVDAK